MGMQTTSPPTQATPPRTRKRKINFTAPAVPPRPAARDNAIPTGLLTLTLLAQASSGASGLGRARKTSTAEDPPGPRAGTKLRTLRRQSRLTPRPSPSAVRTTLVAQAGPPRPWRAAGAGERRPLGRGPAAGPPPGCRDAGLGLRQALSARGAVPRDAYLGGGKPALRPG